MFVQVSYGVFPFSTAVESYRVNPPRSSCLFSYISIVDNEIIFNYNSIIFKFSYRQNINIFDRRMGNENSALSCACVPRNQTKEITIQNEANDVPAPNLNKVPSKCSFVYIHPKLIQENDEKSGEIYDGKSLHQKQIEQIKKIQQLAEDKPSSKQQIGKIIIQRNAFIKIKKQNYLKNYIHLKDIGQGSYGTVSKIKMKYTGFIRAAKIIQISAIERTNEEKEKAIAEITIPMKLDHPNVNRLHEVYEWKKKYILIMQICQGGDLFDKIKKSGTFSERKVSQIMKQILSAISYLHSLGIAHRDLKPENILYDQKSGELKIIDFGTAIQLNPGKKLKKIVGSLFYLAPEVIKECYTEKCDVWSCGVILYILLSGTPPFYGKNQQDIMKKIKAKEVQFEDSIWTKRSRSVKDLVYKMLTKDPEKRITAFEALNSEWIKTASENESVEVQKSMIKNLESFYFKNKLKALVYTYIASQLYSDKDKEKLLRTFREIDKDGNGVIQKSELMKIFQDQKGNTFSESEVERIINLVDTNDSGLIDFTEFLVAASNEEELLKRQRLDNAFSYLDADKNGYLTVEEIKNFLDDSQETSKEIKAIFDEVDNNGDGKISKHQFLSLLVNKQG